MDLNHIHLHVASVERAAMFYETCFGLSRHVWHGDILFMRDGAGMDLALAPAEMVEPMPACADPDGYLLEVYWEPQPA